MEYKQIVYITPKEKERIDKYLTVEPTCKEDCLPVGCDFYITADFGNGYEMDIKLCGAVLFHNGCEVGCTETDQVFDGHWIVEHGDDTFIAVVECKEKPGYAVRLNVSRDSGFEHIFFSEFEDALMEFINQVKLERKNILENNDDRCPDGLIVELVYGKDYDLLLSADFRYGSGKIERFV